MSLQIEWLNIPVAEINHDILHLAKNRQAILTKPAGSLGRLEDIAIKIASMQGNSKPDISRIQCSIFAADHGIATEGVSAFPQIVTGEMIRNFSSGGAAICVLSRAIGANLEVLNLGTINELGALKNVKNCTLGPGTENFVKEPAMNEQQLSRAIHTGRQAVERAKLEDYQLFIGGEMGIANTSSATAIACALLEIAPEKLAGPGTGLDKQAVSNKAQIILKGLNLHKAEMKTPLDILRCVGGFEIAALVGAYISCAQIGIPALVDGYISTISALLADRILPGVNKWLLFSHASAEPGHQIILNALNAKPLLDLNMRLGEGSGAATTVPLLQLACKLHNEMASFTEASVSNKDLMESCS